MLPIMNCLDNLSNCDAGCCKTMVFNVVADMTHATVILRTVMTEDTRSYYRWHDLLCGRDTIAVPRSYCEQRGDKLFVHKTCNALSHDGKCRLHGTKAKPKVCTGLNENTAKCGRYYITPGCIYG